MTRTLAKKCMNCKYIFFVYNSQSPQSQVVLYTVHVYSMQKFCLCAASGLVPCVRSYTAYQHLQICQSCHYKSQYKVKHKWRHLLAVEHQLLHTIEAKHVWPIYPDGSSQNRRSSSRLTSSLSCRRARNAYSAVLAIMYCEWLYKITQMSEEMSMIQMVRIL